MLLNVDGGELPDEPEELYAIADVIHVACGGHAGDEASMTRVVRACKHHVTRIGAHPSYVDREGFGRRAMAVAPDVLGEQVRAQCAALRSVAEREGVAVTSAKPHGALYHAAHSDRAVADACVRAIKDALGVVPVVGLPNGALEAAAKAAGLPYLVEAFADRGVLPDGSLVPRGQPGALVEDPTIAAKNAREIAARKSADTLCIHGDTPNAVAIARAVRAVL
jgi:5-oxoprolinase (ATP-hydrolysing) subunit A